MEINSFFRTYSPDHQGILYQVIKKNENNYTCTGSRSIGEVEGKIIWELGGYVDDMPIEAMHDISSPRPMTTLQTIKFVEKNKLDKKYESMNLYSDEYGYWFKAERKSRNRQRSRTNRSRTNRSRSNRSRSRTNRSRTNRSRSNR
jgi:hypothetical protein